MYLLKFHIGAVTSDNHEPDILSTSTGLNILTHPAVPNNMTCTDLESAS